MGYSIRKIETENLQFKKSRKVLIAIFIGITAQILIITKNYAPYTQYYLIPSFMLLVTGLYVSVSIFHQALKKYFQRISLNQIYMSITLILAGFAIVTIFNAYKEAVQFRDEAYKIRNLIKNDYKNELVIPSLMTANEDCALAYMVFHDYGGANNKKYTDFLAGILPTEIYYDFSNNFFTIPENINIEKTIHEHKKIIVQLCNGATLKPFTNFLKKRYNIDSINEKEILTNKNGESIHEIEIK